MERIEADALIPGRGEAINGGCVVFDGPTITYAGPQESAPQTPAGTRTYNVPAVMPGMWDAHAHFTGLRKNSMEEVVYTSDWVGIVRASRDAAKALRAGFTSIREVGGFGVYLARAVNEGSIPGPRIYASGACLSPVGGHGDVHEFPLEFVRFMANRLEYPGPCGGVTECVEAVRKVLRLGARVVKVVATGGVMSYLDDPAHRQFSDEELRAIVGEAALADRIVAAHCHGKPGIMAALRAGIKTIEHGTFLDDEAAEVMVENGALLVPTRLMVTQIAARGKESGMPEHMLEKARKITDRHREALRCAIRKKVSIALGTDIMGSSDAAVTWWGAHGKELPLLVEDGGMTPLQAIEAATANGPLTLGPQAPRSGQLQEGYDSDIITVNENPLKRIAALADPGNMLHVWKAGRLEVDRALASEGISQAPDYPGLRAVR